MNSKVLFSQSLPILAILAATAAGTPAFAADSAANTAIVHYSDLDLSTPKGEAKLNRRLARAADDVCVQEDGATIQEHERFQSCRSNALASAQPTLNAVIASARSDHRYAMNGSVIAMLAR